MLIRVSAPRGFNMQRSENFPWLLSPKSYLLRLPCSVAWELSAPHARSSNILHPGKATYRGSPYHVRSTKQE